VGAGNRKAELASDTHGGLLARETTNSALVEEGKKDTEGANPKEERREGGDYFTL